MCSFFEDSTKLTPEHYLQKIGEGRERKEWEKWDRSRSGERICKWGFFRKLNTWKKEMVGFDWNLKKRSIKDLMGKCKHVF